MNPEEMETIVNAFEGQALTITELLDKLDPGSASLGYCDLRREKSRMYRRLVYLEQKGLVKCTEYNRGSKSNKWEAIA